MAQQPAGQEGHSADHPPAIQRMAAAGGSAAGDGLRQAIGQARGGGRPVPAELRGSMERALGADFSRVRLHADARADQFNRALQARAFTIGRDIFFRRGDYNPGSPRGRQLLAHELTHVVQQGGGTRNAAPAVQREVIQRELTDEARRVLELANENQPDFTKLPDKENFFEGRAEAIGLLEKSKYILAVHLQQVMDLPPGAPEELRSFVQAWLLRHLCADFLSYIVPFGHMDEEKRPEFIDLLVAKVEAIKKALVDAGYGQAGEMTPEVKSVITKDFGSSGIVPLNLDAHGISHVPAADPRKVEVCATYIPGRKMDILGRAHSFIMYTDVSGLITYISAHDDGKGWLKAAYGAWSPSIFDDKNLSRVIVATGHEASSAFPKMIDAVEALNASGLKYKMTEQNCNSATHFILRQADIQAAAPSTMTGQFGWRKKLEKKINKPVPVNPAMPLPQTVTTTTAVPVPQTTTTTTAVPQTVASTAMPLIPLQFPALPPLPGTVARTTATAQAVGGATVTTQTALARRQPREPSRKVRSVKKAKPRLQPRPAPRGREEEELPAEQPTQRVSGGTQAAELAAETHELLAPVPLKGQNDSLPKGTRITLNKISYRTDTADIQVLDGPRSVLVALTKLEAAVGKPLT